MSTYFISWYVWFVVLLVQEVQRLQREVKDLRDQLVAVQNELKHTETLLEQEQRDHAATCTQLAAVQTEFVITTIYITAHRLIAYGNLSTTP